MPGVNDVEATKRVSSVDAETKVVFISADDTVREEAMSADAVAFVQKPVTMKEILETSEGIGYC